MKQRFSACRGWMLRLRPLLVPAAAVLCAALASRFLVTAAYIPSGSMEPALPSGTVVLGVRTAYTSGLPARGDIVLFERPDIAEGFLIKRVVALPGQCFEMRAGRVYLDGELLDEPYVREFSKEDYPPVLVPPGCCIVLGDNRNASRDSRFWQDPFVRQEQLMARAEWAVFPFIKAL